MLTRDSLYVILYSLPIYQLLFYTVQVITLKRVNPARRYLGLMLLSMTSFLIINAIYHLGYVNMMEWLYYLFVPLLLITLPVFYLYISALARGNRDVDPRTRLILFLPPIVMFMLNLITYRAIPSDLKAVFIRDGFLFSSGQITALNNAALLHGFGLAGLLLIQMVLTILGGYKLLRRETREPEQPSQHLAYLKMNWIVAVAACILLFLAGSALLNLFGPAREMTPAIVFNTLMLIAGGLTGYFGMKQDELLDQVYKVRSLASGPVAIPEEPSAEPEESGAADLPLDEATKPTGFISEEESGQIIRSIDEIMRKGKPYLNPKFSLHDLCTLTNVSRRKMTFVINEIMQKNFYGVVNDYRIEESIRILESNGNPEYKMDSIAEMVGFNSKSSFYACFKKYTGITPTEYRSKKGIKGNGTR